MVDGFELDTSSHATPFSLYHLDNDEPWKIALEAYQVFAIQRNKCPKGLCGFAWQTIFTNSEA